MRWKNLMELEIFASIIWINTSDEFLWNLLYQFKSCARFFFPLCALFSIRICINIRINHFESNWVHFCFILFHPCMQISDRSVETSLSHEILRDQTLLHTRYEFRTRKEFSTTKSFWRNARKLLPFVLHLHIPRRGNNVENNSCV